MSTLCERTVKLQARWLSDARVVGQVDQKFILCLLPGEGCEAWLVLFDQHALHERVLLEELQTRCSAQEGSKRSRPDLESRACHSALRFGDVLTRSECRHLLRSLAMCSLPFQCAHGRPSAVPLADVAAASEPDPEGRLRFERLRSARWRAGLGWFWSDRVSFWCRKFSWCVICHIFLLLCL